MIFKREKEIARKLEFDGLYVDNDPSDDDLSGQWDRLVISCPSFPSKYWDKFVKKKVCFKIFWINLKRNKIDFWRFVWW